MDTEPVPAATVVPLRDGPTGLEVLMLRKSQALAFGGMWVFPGGRVDPADTGAVEAADSVEAARRAAVREAGEEAGLALDPAGLVPLSHWTPPGDAPRRFSTWFFLAGVADPVEVVIDGGEILDHGWLSPGDALARRDRGAYPLAPPTWMTLRHLTGSASVSAALAAAASAPVAQFSTRIYTDGGVPTGVWQGDAAWGTGDLSLPGPRHRLLMDPSGWRLEASGDR